MSSARRTGSGKGAGRGPGDHQTAAQRARPAFTLVELLVTIALIMMLSSLLFPVFTAARERARESVCRSNLRQFGLAMGMYWQDYEAPPLLFRQFVPSYVEKPLMVCPSDPFIAEGGYYTLDYVMWKPHPPDWDPPGPLPPWGEVITDYPISYCYYYSVAGWPCAWNHAQSLENGGWLVCVLHGDRYSWHSLRYDGRTLRLLFDGSVRVFNVVWERGDDMHWKRCTDEGGDSWPKCDERW